MSISTTSKCRSVHGLCLIVHVSSGSMNIKVRKAALSASWLVLPVGTTSPFFGDPAHFKTPIITYEVDGSAILLTELSWDLENRNHQATFRRPGRVSAACRPPNEFASDHT